MIKINITALSNINKLSFSNNINNDLDVFWVELSGSEIAARVITPLMHRHSFFELHIILDGGVNCFLEDKCLTLEKDSFVLLAPNTMHRIEPSQNGFTRLSITFLAKAGSMLDKMLSSKGYITGQANDSIINAIEVVSKYGAVGGHYAETLCYGRIFEIIYSIAQNDYYSAPIYNNQRSVNDYLDKAKKYILDNPHLFLNCEEVAAYCHISSKQLGRIFEKYEKMSLHKYLHSCKLKDAQNLIENTDLPFSKISSMLGFNTDNYFNSFFKKGSGMSPGQYRKIFRK